VEMADGGIVIVYIGKTPVISGITRLFETYVGKPTVISPKNAHSALDDVK